MTKNDLKTNVSQFTQFVDLTHPIDIYLIPLARHTKTPDVPKGKSWKAPKYRLSVADAIKRLKKGKNVGVVAKGDLVFFDHDDLEKYECPRETLTSRSRNGMIHKTYLNGGDVKNADGKGRYKGCGEIRALDKYIVAPGSFVPPDKDAIKGANGEYVIINPIKPVEIFTRFLPKEFRPTPTVVELPKDDPPIVTKKGTFNHPYNWSLTAIRKRDPKLDDSLDNSMVGFASPSERDMSVLTKLLYWGYSQQEAVAILKQWCPRKKLERGDYINSTLSKIHVIETIADHVNVKKWNPKNKKPPSHVINRLKAKYKKPSVIETQYTSAELDVRALNFLRSPDLLHQVKKILDKGIIVDNRLRAVIKEDDKKLHAFCVAVSAKSLRPQNLLISGTSGYGKSNIVSAVLALMPPDYVKFRSYFTAAGLRYGSQDYKLLFIREWRNPTEEDTRLTMGEDGSYEYEIAVKDKESGEWTTQTGKIPARTIITTTAEELPTTQTLRRLWLQSVDETAELTKDINEYKAKFRLGDLIPVSQDKVAVIQQAIKTLEPCPVIIPFAEKLLDLTKWDRSRLDQFYDFIDTVAWVHQFQREKDEQQRIIATPQDLYISFRVCWGALAQSLQKLPLRLKKCWNILPEVSSKTAGMIIKDIALTMGVAQSTIRGYMNDLLNLNYAVCEKLAGKREKSWWRVTDESRSVASVEKVMEHLNWQEITALVKQRQEKANSTSVEVLNDSSSLTKKHIVIDPISGNTMDLITGSTLQHFSDKAGEDSDSETEDSTGELSVEPEIQHFQRYSELEIISAIKEGVGHLTPLHDEGWLPSSALTEFVSKQLKGIQVECLKEYYQKLVTDKGYLSRSKKGYLKKV